MGNKDLVHDFDTVFPTEKNLADFQQNLIDWFSESGKDYPWRNTRDPYAVLVSELMLQQTRIATVLERGYYTHWMEKFPSVHVLSRAQEEDILKAWEGLGYYNRARNLQKAAQTVVNDHAGAFPATLEEIESLPGVGRYTAGAVYSFAYGRRAPIVDGNVVRVLSRLFCYEEPVDTTAARKLLWDWAEHYTPESNVREFNSAIMELGQTICVRSSPRCQGCPIRVFCLAYARGKESELPKKSVKTAITRRDENVAICIRSGKIFLTEEDGTRRKGLLKLPEISEEQSADLFELFRFPYAITRFRVEMRIFLSQSADTGSITEGRAGRWYPLGNGENLPAMGAPYRKAVQKYLDMRDDLMMNH